MSENIKDKVRPIYSELQGFLANAPVTDDGFNIKNIRNMLNQSIDELNAITAKDYGRYRILIEECYGPQEKDWLKTVDYKTKLGAIIARLHAEHFSVEPTPFAGMPSTIIHATQTQSQSVDIQFLLNVQSKISEQLIRFPEGSNKRTFLQKLKDSLGGIKDANQLLSQLVTLAKSSGLSIDDLSNIFS